MLTLLAKNTVLVSPTFHMPRQVSVTPKMVHMVQNKHNSESHSKDEIPRAVKAMLWGGVEGLGEAIQQRGSIKGQILTWPEPTEMAVTSHLALCPDLTF